MTGEVNPKPLGVQGGKGRFQNRGGKKEEAPVKFKRGPDAEESAAPVKESKDLKEIRKRSRTHTRKDFESDDEEEEEDYSDSNEDEEEEDEDESYIARSKSNKRQKLNEAGKQKLKRNSEKEPVPADEAESGNQEPKVYESGDEDVYESVAQLQGPKVAAVEQEEKESSSSSSEDESGGEKEDEVPMM